MKIDLVYLWVDNNDEEWLKKRGKYDMSCANKDAVSMCRFYNNDELKYSLRSVSQNLSWINNIYVITDNQVPDWLNIKNNRINIVNHSDIVSEDYLPLFNSCAIESRIPYIENLSEFFIYANDDMFFWEPIPPEFFFRDKKPVYIAGKRIAKKKYKHLYGYTVERMHKLIKDCYRTDIPFFPHHNADPYRKSLFLKCINEFQEEFEQTLSNRFRAMSDMQRSIVMYYSIAQNMAILDTRRQNLLLKVLGIPIGKSLAYDLNWFNFAKIKAAQCKLLCINDSRRTNNKIRAVIKQFLEDKFPTKSEFEK